MKLLITHVYSRDNNGDAAILTSLIHELRRILKNPELTISTMEKETWGEVFDNVPHIPSLLTVADDGSRPLTKMFNVLRSWTVTLLWSVVCRLSHKRINWLLQPEERVAMNELANTNVVIAVGGGYIQSKSGLKETLDLMLVLWPFYLSYVLNKKVILYTQSIGPFGSRFHQWLAATVIRRADLVIVRESISRELLKKMRVDDCRVDMAADAAFLLAREKMSGTIPSQLLDMRLKHKGLLIGVTARNWLHEDEQERYEHEFAKALDTLIQTYDARIVFIPQVTVAKYEDDDRVVQKRIHTYMKEKECAINMDGRYNFNDIRVMYSTLDVLIGTRFHSVIFALGAGVPALAIEYEYKTRGIMKDLGLEEWIIPIGEVTALRLVDLFEKLSIRKDEYLGDLKIVMPDYIASAEKAADRMREIILLATPNRC